MRNTAFYWDEKCFWHSGGNYAFTAPVGGVVQPLAAGGIPENPETKRRFKNLIEYTGLAKQLTLLSAPMVSWEELKRVHPESYLQQFKDMSDQGGGELGLRVPFGQGGFELAALSAGLVRQALCDVLDGRFDNAYALSRPPGHHCLPDYPNGFCPLANIAIAVESAIAQGKGSRFAVIDWDVHHGNGTEAIFLQRPDVLTVSMHQENNYPPDSGAVEVTGEGAGKGFNLNVPLPPGGGHALYLYAMDQLVLPVVRDFDPDVIIIACGFDASIVDPLSRMLAGSHTFRAMTQRVQALADELCDGRLVMAHEGGYSELHVPFCGHAVLEEMSGSDISPEDPMSARSEYSQPNATLQKYHEEIVDGLKTSLVSWGMLS